MAVGAKQHREVKASTSHLFLCQWRRIDPREMSTCHRDSLSVIQFALFVYVFGRSDGSMKPILAESVWRRMEKRLHKVCTLLILQKTDIYPVVCHIRQGF